MRDTRRTVLPLLKKELYEFGFFEVAKQSARKFVDLLSFPEIFA
jgi:hypothetical protein